MPINSPRWNSFLFWTMVLLLLAPVWIFKYVPTSDGPCHLYNAICLRDYLRPDREAIRSFFALNLHPFPNWGASLLLTGLCCIFPPFVAEKVFLSLYLVGFMLAVRWALASIDASRTTLAVAAAPFAANFYFHLGLYSFCFGLALYFFVIAYWLRQERRPALHKTIVLAALLLLLYFAHMVPLVLAELFIALMLLLRLLRARSSGPEAVRTAGWRVALSALAMAPASVLALIYLLTNHSTRFAAPGPNDHFWPLRLRYVVSWMKSFQPIEFGPGILQTMLFTGLVAWLIRRRRGRFRPNDVYLAAVGMYFCVFLLSPPSAAGGSMILVRLACFPFFAILLWVASEPLENETRRRLDLTVSAISSVAFAGLLLCHLQSYARINPYLQEFADAESLVPPGSTLLPIAWAEGADLDKRGRRISIGSTPLFEAADDFSAQNGIVALDNYEASVDYFPLIFRAGFDPFVRIIDRGWDFEDYRSPRGQPVDYVLLWTGGLDRNDAIGRNIIRQLDNHYQLIFTSGYSGYAKLYRLR
jgi:hypothetical protein